MTVVVFQLILTGIISVLFLIFGGTKAGYSAVSGGMAGFIPCLLVVSIMFSKWGTANPRRARKAFLLGEVIKVFFAMVIMILSIAWLKAEAVAVIVAYAATFLAFWLTLLLTLVPPVSKER